ncbi:MAG TPA: hypothetical protein VMV33_17125 [Rhodocyclaceae bacterium]|nr:hypothetical protein [Rhodocyclaceae bacterium]
MAVPVTSGVTGFTQSAFDLISAALRLCNVISEEEVPTASMAQRTLEALNAMATGWQASGIHVWTSVESILFVQPGQTQYLLGSGSTDHACLFSDLAQSRLSFTADAGASSVLVTSIAGLAAGDNFGIQLDAGVNFWTTIVGTPAGSTVTLADALPSAATGEAITFGYGAGLLRPLRVPAARRYIYASGIQNNITVLSQQDYDQLPNPFQTGQINQFFYQPTTGNGVYSEPLGQFNVWQTPADYYAGVRFISQRPLQNFVTLADIPDFPAEWTATLRWNLALEIAPEYDVPIERVELIRAKATEWFARASSWDREPQPILFGMAMSPGYR